jgi:hypothetical protein
MTRTRQFRIDLPFGCSVQVGYNYWHHIYESPVGINHHSSHRFVVKPFVIFDPPVFRGWLWLTTTIAQSSS